MIEAKKSLKIAQKWVTEIVFAFIFKPFFEAVFSKISIVKPPNVGCPTAKVISRIALLVVHLGS